MLHTANQVTTLTEENYRSKLLIWEKGTQKYKMTLSSEMQLNTLNIKNTVETNFVIQIKDCTKKDILIDILSYDKEMTSCNNEGIKEMFTVTRHFEKLYDEFKAVITWHGKIKEIKNFDYLKDKWQKIKNDSLQYFDKETDIEQFFNLNDTTVNDQQFWTKALNEQEILFLYFELANYNEPFTKTHNNIERENAFKSNKILWSLSEKTEQEKSTAPFDITKRIEGRFEPSKKWMEKSYSSMPFFKDIPFKEHFAINANYKFDALSGFIKYANVELEETIHPNILFHKLNYKLTPIP